MPIVEENFAALLTKFKVRPDPAANIAENISRPGRLRVFEDPEILLKRLTMWSSESPQPGERTSWTSGLPKGVSTFPLRFNQRQG